MTPTERTCISTAPQWPARQISTNRLSAPSQRTPRPQTQPSHSISSSIKRNQRSGKSMHNLSSTPSFQFYLETVPKDGPPTRRVSFQITPSSISSCQLHLHGHSFWVLGKGSGDFDASQLNTDNPPVRDTEGIPASGWLAIRYVADNPGAWIFHCHIDWYLPAHASINDRHLAAGMAVVLVEGEGQFPAIPANVLAVPSYI
jgi:Multicopper oxidase